MATILEEEFSRIGLSLPKDTEKRLELYIRELEHWNRAVNLTSLAGAELARRLIAEPCWIGQELQMSGNLLDVGSGNGCPGVPLSVFLGLGRVDLIEARVRRAAFLRHIAKHLGTDRIVVHRMRLEEMIEAPRNVGWITLQAVDPTPGLIETLQRLFASTTPVVWITSRAASIAAHASRISVPSSNTVAWVSQLDQF